ncbi:MAG: hypothetical protein QOJ65_920, partial [Fimbriimonadaceae bacterium]|nr:hypothetical protein [Fimbriimonadaceae bacterium]
MKFLALLVLATCGSLAPGSNAII